MLDYILRSSARRFRQTGNVVHLSAYRQAMVLCGFSVEIITLALSKLIRKRKERADRLTRADVPKS